MPIAGNRIDQGGSPIHPLVFVSAFVVATTPAPLSLRSQCLCTLKGPLRQRTFSVVHISIRVGAGVSASERNLGMCRSIKSMLGVSPIFLDPMKKEMRRPAVRIRRKASVAMMRALVKDTVTRRHRDGAIGL